MFSVFVRTTDNYCNELAGGIQQLKSVYKLSKLKCS